MIMTALIISTAAVNWLNKILLNLFNNEIIVLFVDILMSLFVVPIIQKGVKILFSIPLAFAQVFEDKKGND